MIADFFAKRVPLPETSAAASALKAVECPAQNGSTMFAELCAVFESISSTTKRLVISDFLADFFLRLMQSSAADDLTAACLLSLCRLGPEYEGVELGLGEALLVKALSQSTGKSSAFIKQELADTGDIGVVADKARAAQRTMFPAKPLSLQSLLKTLNDVARASGLHATHQRVSRVQGLLVACSPLEAKYLFRLLAGKLRIGLAEQSVLIALGEASKRMANSSIADPGNVVKSVFHTAPDYHVLISKLLAVGIDHLHEHISMSPGIPVKPMLAHPTKAISQVLDRFEGIPFTCEFKYDGERAQIHRLSSEQVMIFSRNLENMTGKYPDIIKDILPQASRPVCHDFVIDCEVVAWDPVAKRLLPFQVLSTRKRKDVQSVEVQVCLFVFDMLYCNGQSLLQHSFKDRKRLMVSMFAESDTFHFARSLDTDKIEEIQSFLDEAIQSGCEGLMVKVFDGPESSYEPSKRSRNWLKVKKDYLGEGEIGDSVDLVPVGGYWGRGKRTGVFGGFLLACFDPDSEEYQAVCKIGTGFSEAHLDAFAKQLSTDIVPHKLAYVKTTDSVAPDVWFEPKQVWEVKAADLSLSPVYSAAIGNADSQRGVSLRFPRFIRVRDDKSVEEATSAEQLADMYREQAIVKQNLEDGNDEFDY